MQCNIINKILSLDSVFRLVQLCRSKVFCTIFGRSQQKRNQLYILKLIFGPRGEDRMRLDYLKY